tara:strand:- start:885 stop:1337 length:453 start_codon:yes stop_codon:yes gene_type:complete
MQSWIKPFPAVLLFASFLASCAQPIEIHGNRITLRTVNAIELGKTTEKQVLEELGKPVITQEYGSKSWIYVESKSQKTILSGRKFIDRKVVRVSFNKKGIATSVDIIPFDKELNPEISPRKTPTAGQEITVLQQLIGNFGRFENKNDQGF